MGIFSRKKDNQTVEATDTSEVLASSPENGETTSAPASAPVAEIGVALRALAQKMRKKADGQVTLELAQTGSDMSFTFYQRGNELESATVLPGHEWFAEIADLYVEEEKSERGAFSRALIVVNPSVQGEQAVQASFMSTDQSSNHNLSYSLVEEETAADQLPVAEAEQTPAVPPAVPAAAGVSAEENPVERVTARLAQHQENSVAADDTAAEVEEIEEVETAGTEAPLEGSEESTGAASEVEQSGSVISQSASTAPVFTSTHADTVAEEEGAEPEYMAQRFAYSPQETAESAGAEPGESDLASSLPAVAEAAEVTETTEAEGEPPADEPVYQGTEGAEETEHDNLVTPTDLPAHLDDAVFGDDTEDVTSAPVAEGAAAAAPLDAPTAGTNVDISPSFASPTIAAPSETQLAEGNLVLSEAEVVSRFTPAYETLFGQNGTARDVSTVLIRVRTLGSYYDALTHVRRNGFWEQVRTFDLIPEETLAVLQLKADSYKEGSGSPLAMNIRFTPGVPVQASFDYNNEEAFVTYPERLPAQQYVEELRMFPRTGANISAPMNEALAAWTF
ncbi:MAG: hypothetical protein Q3965_03925 [Rothia sp. (in: high G+C Gram-positive bacteria)]|nr:hypothetical protein [Rothia sp. (in: high G+C Gram-positive bacteria)]